MVKILLWLDLDTAHYQLLGTPIQLEFFGE